MTYSFKVGIQAFNTRGHCFTYNILCSYNGRETKTCNRNSVSVVLKLFGLFTSEKLLDHTLRTTVLYESCRHFILYAFLNFYFSDTLFLLHFTKVSVCKGLEIFLKSGSLTTDSLRRIALIQLCMTKLDISILILNNSSATSFDRWSLLVLHWSSTWKPWWLNSSLKTRCVKKII